MQRKFLEELGLEKDVIDKIMAENGSDIEKVKADRDNYKSQLKTAQEALKTAQEALKDFEGVDVKELNGKIAQLNNDLAAKDTEYQQKIADMEFNSVLDSAITAAGARNAKALKALLDIESLKSSKNQAEDIKSAIDAVKTDNGYLFNSDEPFQNPVHQTNNNPINQMSGVEKAFYERNPDIKI